MESMTITQPAATQQSSSISTQRSYVEQVAQKSVNENRVDADISENKKELKPQEIKKEFNKLSDDLNLDIKFAYNEKIDTQYISVTDKITGQVIRKLPTEEAMKIKESMADLVGVLLDKKG